MTGKTFVVAGNGPSLARITPGTVLIDDTILRVNSFFFEPELYLGPRVDLVFLSGDPRIVPFICAAIRKAKDIYSVQRWSASTPRVEAMARRWLGQPFVPYRLREPRLAQEIDCLCAKHQALPTSGVRAVLLAHAMGAEKIILAGIDLYEGPRRYSHASGPHQRALLGEDLDTRGYDRDQHSRDLDLAVLEHLSRRDDLLLALAAPVPGLGDMMPLADLRDGAAVQPEPKRQITDWPVWAGVYPIHLLRALRWARKVQRRLTG